ncbi:hypothetical protein [Aldersonia kunmingensis]|nr:hypothetical protein [Aldersonia kunmingensis]
MYVLIALAALVPVAAVSAATAIAALAWAEGRRIERAQQSDILSAHR